ncbi:unnamed protein product [Lactuca saligna]|uniref:Uncharacterized protein n=1 Tax=Lactuca saligna TaxID=75948 RepID=A0AA36A753_LACSI|nr:unnamed protein product [Lactuca saligna]
MGICNTMSMRHHNPIHYSTTTNDKLIILAANHDMFLSSIALLVDIPCHSDYNAPFQPFPLSNPPPSTPSLSHNTPLSSTRGSSPHADDAKKGENDKAIVFHTDHVENVDEPHDTDTDDEEGFLDMDFMLQAVPLNIIYLEANIKWEFHQGFESDVECDNNLLITRKRIPSP